MFRRCAPALLAAVLVVGVVGAAAGPVAGAAGAPASSASAAGRWEKVPFASTGLPVGGGPVSVVAFHGGLVGVGDQFTGSDGFGGPQGAAFRSTDGRHWDAVVPNPFGDTPMLGVVATRSSLLAFGEPENGNQLPSRVWSSADGSNWTRLTDAAPPGMRMVVAAPIGYVGAGTDTEPGCAASMLSCWRAAIWTSKDGRVWTRVAGGSDEFPPGNVASLVRTSRAVVAVGSRWDGAVPKPVSTLIWSSATGARWQLRTPHGLGPTAAAAGLLGVLDRRLMLVGFAPSRAAGPPTTTTTFPPTTIQTAGGTATETRLCLVTNGVPATWTSTDANRWSPMRAPGLQRTSVGKLVAAHGQWIVAGSEGDCSSSHAVVYTSTDGRAWRKAVSEPALPPGTTGPVRYPVALAPTARGAVAVIGTLGIGNGGPDIWIWTAHPNAS